jgi:hypothetical protein
VQSNFKATAPKSKFDEVVDLIDDDVKEQDTSAAKSNAFDFLMHSAKSAFSPQKTSKQEGIH